LSKIGATSKPPHSLIWFDAESKDPLRDDEGRDLWTVSAGSIRSPVRLPLEFGLPLSFIHGPDKI
jgi:hypothetical protein